MNVDKEFEAVLKQAMEELDDRLPTDRDVQDEIISRVGEGLSECIIEYIEGCFLCKECGVLIANPERIYPAYLTEQWKWIDEDILFEDIDSMAFLNAKYDIMCGLCGEELFTNMNELISRFICTLMVYIHTTPLKMEV